MRFETEYFIPYVPLTQQVTGLLTARQFLLNNVYVSFEVPSGSNGSISAPTGADGQPLARSVGHSLTLPPLKHPASRLSLLPNSLWETRRYF